MKSVCHPSSPLSLKNYFYPQSCKDEEEAQFFVVFFKIIIICFLQGFSVCFFFCKLAKLLWYMYFCMKYPLSLSSLFSWQR